MTSSELGYYIRVRNGELNQDEILNCIDVTMNPQIDHISYENNEYRMWDKEGNEFYFKRRNW